MTTRAGGGGDRNRWRPIAGELRYGIRAGLYPPGERLPTSAELRARYAVSGQTVQHAINALRDEGLLVTRPGLGWFVRKPPDVVCLVRRPEPRRDSTGRIESPPSYYGSEAANWSPAVSTMLRVEEAGMEIASALQIVTGDEVLVRERTWSEDGEVIALATSYFARSLTRGTVIETDDTGPGGIFARLLELGHCVVGHVERVSVGATKDEHARRFGRPDHPVVFRVLRTTLGARCVLGAIEIIALADRFELRYELPVIPR